MTAFEPPTPPGLQLEDLAGSPGRNRTEHLVRLALTGAAATSVLISVAIIYVLLSDALAFLSTIKLSDLSDDVWNPRLGRFGVMSPVLGTLWVTFIAVLVAGPIGLGAAIYLSEYANREGGGGATIHHCAGAQRGAGVVGRAVE